MLYEKTGITIYNKAKATSGFTLFSPINQTKTYIVNMRGEVVHEWQRDLPPGNSGYLLPNGNLFMAMRTPEGPKALAAKGGVMREYDWDGKVVWEHVNHYQHHDARRCANGNTVYPGWELFSPEAQARVQGGYPGTEHEGRVWGDYIREVSPDGRTVWEWHAETDQDIEKYPICGICSRGEFAHANSVWPTGEGDVLVSWRQNHLIALIDRRTKRFKWEMMDMDFGHQHDASVLPNGNVLLFANGDHTKVHGGLTCSRVLEIDMNTSKIVWQYQGNPRYTFYSPHISGAQRLGSDGKSAGNTLICEGLWGRLFEVTPEGDIVWNYISPFFIPPVTKGGHYGGNPIFRCYRYAPDSPEIRGRLGPSAD